MPRDLVYEANNVAYYAQDNCNGIKCKNYEICKNVLPEYSYTLTGHYYCTDCVVWFFDWGVQPKDDTFDFTDNTATPPMPCYTPVTIRRDKKETI